MRIVASPQIDRQNVVDSYFEAHSSYWKEIYNSFNAEAAIYRDRHAVVLEFVHKLALSPSEPILEIGCGSGLTSVALAHAGYRVHAIDTAEAMLQLTRRLAEVAGVAKSVIVSKCDVHHLPFAENSFGLIVEIGVVPWLSEITRAFQEVARVLRPGGHLIVTADNRWRITHWVDPRHFPLLRSARALLRSALERFRIMQPRNVSARLHSIREFDGMLAAAGLEKVEERTIGFGPFSFLGYPILTDRAAVRLHRRLQRLADRGVPVLRSAGSQYVVLARKPWTSYPCAEAEYEQNHKEGTIGRASPHC